MLVITCKIVNHIFLALNGCVVCVCMYVFVYVCVCMYACMYYTYVRVCMHVCVCLYVWVDVLYVCLHLSTYISDVFLRAASCASLKLMLQYMRVSFEFPACPVADRCSTAHGVM